MIQSKQQIREANNKNEELLDGNNVESRLNNVDGEYAPMMLNN